MNEPLPPGYVCHRVRGRARIRVPDRRSDEAFFRQAAEGLKSCPGVHGVRVNPTTAGLLIDYDGDLEALAAFATRGRLFLLEGLEVGEPPLVRRLSDDVMRINEAVRRFARGELDLWAASAITLFALALLQIRRGQVLGPATSLLWAGLAALLRADAHDDRPLRDTIGDDQG